MELILPIPPTCFAEIVLCFEHDFCMDELDKVIGLPSACNCRYSKTQINPISGQHNPGYWEYHTPAFSSFDCSSLWRYLIDLLTNHQNSLQEVKERFSPCDMFVCIRVLVKEEGEYPALRFPPEYVRLLSSLGAYMDVEIDNDYST